MKTLQKAKIDCAKEYRQKLCSPEAAAATVKSGDSLCFPIFAGEPTLFVRALARRSNELEGVVVNQQHHLCPDYFTEDSVPDSVAHPDFRRALTEAARRMNRI